MRILKACLLIGGLGGALALTGCETWFHHRDERSEGQLINDNRITSLVKQDLAREPVYKFQNVGVQTFGGTVQLSGFVNTEDQKRRAGEVAQHVMGVQRVENGIALKPNLSRTGREQAPIEQNNNPAAGGANDQSYQQNQSATNNAAPVVTDQSNTSSQPNNSAPQDNNNNSQK